MTRMLTEIRYCVRAMWKFRGYQPQAVVPRTFFRWIRQYAPDDRKLVLRLLDHIIYVSEKDTRDAMVQINDRLLARLQRDGVRLKNVIYMQIHDAGSSSPVMLNMLRDHSNLERLGCKFLDSKNIRELNDLTNDLEEGAIVYVDDFAGTGNQFSKVRDFVSQHILGNFSEFLLLPAIAEEAIHKLGEIGVEPLAKFFDNKVDRPLNEMGTILESKHRVRLLELSAQIHRNGGLGYKGLATRVVLYRNSPNTVPLLLRGSRDQRIPGIFPRYDDLPIRDDLRALT